MNALRDAMSHAALGWVKPELDETLRQAQAEVEAYAEAPEDAAPLRQYADFLHQVRGTLQMVELYAPAMVAEELEQLAKAVSAGQAHDHDEACATLMRGTVLLPDYLERLQGGHRDIPIVLLPLLNEIRGARGQGTLNETQLAANERLRNAFRLDEAKPSQAELEHAQSSLTGRNRALLDTVGGVVKEELLRLKDALDLHLRTGGDIGQMRDQVDGLGKIAETLGMLGLDEARDVVRRQRDELEQLVSGAQPADEGALLDIAGALLYVDNALDDQAANQAKLSSGTNAGDSKGGMVDVLAQEAINNFAAAREGFVAFIETNWQHVELSRVPQLLAEVAGALRILELADAAQLVEGTRRYVAIELIGKQRVPGGQQLDTLADAMASLEYYLEALREQRGDGDSILAITRSSLEALKYWPLPDLPAGFSYAAPLVPGSLQAPKVATPVEPAGDRADFSSFLGEAPPAAVPAPDSSSAIAQAAEAAPAAPVAPAGGPIGIAEGGFDTSSGDIDNDIREVFLEEFDEEIQNLGVLLPPWRAAPNETEKLRPIRRVFHTLKGSGRLVGANALGEFSWKIENMLNRVLDGTRPASDAVIALLGVAEGALPQFSAALRGVAPIQIDVEGVKEVADKVAAGEEAFHVEKATPALGAEPAVVATGEGTPANVDNAMREILDTEVTQHLQTVREWIDKAKSSPSRVDDALLRAMHTMNGAFGMAEVPEITDVTGPAEGYVKRLLLIGALVPLSGVTALADAADAIEAALHALSQPAQHIPAFEELSQRLAMMRDRLPPPQATAPIVPHDAPAPQAETPAPTALPAPEPAATDPANPFGDIDFASMLDSTSLDAPAIVPPPPSESIDFGALGFDASALDFKLDVAEPAPEEAEPPMRVFSFEDIRLPEPEPVPEESIEFTPAPLTEEQEAFIASFEAPPASEHAEDAPAGIEEVSFDLPPPEPAPVLPSHPQLPPLSAPISFDAPPALPIDDEDGPDEALDFSDLDAELVDIFAEEGAQLLDEGDGLLAQLRDNPNDAALVVALQRNLHTLKGGARMAGIYAIGDLGHAIESLLEQVAEKRATLAADDVRLLEQGFDKMHAMLGRVSKHRAVRIPNDLIAGFNARVRGQQIAPVAVAEKPALPKDMPALSAPIDFDEAIPAPISGSPNAPIDALEDAAPVPVQASLSATLADAPAAPARLVAAAAAGTGDVADAPANLQAGQDMVRVRAELLDRLVNNAGEVAIYRARLEQQLGAFRTTMAEMERTNARLHDQLRRLDLETEAQIVARYQRETEDRSGNFDPLEMDRFTTMQQLSRALAESAADISGMQGTLEELSRQQDLLLQQQSRVSAELQDGLMRARMVPFDGIVPRLRRVVRAAAGETAKQARLQVDGAHGEMDRTVLERMTGPLEHLLRNSLAHGIEAPDQRGAAGKNAEGVIRIALRREGSEMVLEVGDDGAGLNHDAIRRRAEQRGLVQSGAPVTIGQLERMILEPGFSTAESVSQLAGRGVGMDVVHNEVRQLGGTLDIRSAEGKGTSFVLRLPQTLAVSQAVFVQIGDAQYAVPVAAVSGVGRIARKRFESGEGHYVYAGEEYSLYDLGLLVGQNPTKAEGQPQVPLLLIRAGELRAAVAVDQVLGNREIVVKPVGPQVTSIPGIYGATITGDGRVVVILDAAPLVRRHQDQPHLARVAEPQEQRHVPLVMVVDDSLTMRKVTSRVLERHNFEVAQARDGVEALEILDERVPDLMLLDVEMPRMDGYELATAMRADLRFRQVPIIMITSRTGDKHRQRAFDIGVQRYMGKPYQELDLMRNVYDLLGIARGRD